jgi:hypothetical protein
VSRQAGRIQAAILLRQGVERVFSAGTQYVQQQYRSFD